MTQDVKQFLEEVNKDPKTALRVFRNLYNDKISLVCENKELKKDLIEQNSDKLWPIFYEKMLELEDEVKKWKELSDDGDAQLRKAKNENTDLRMEIKRLKEENADLINIIMEE